MTFKPAPWRLRLLWRLTGHYRNDGGAWWQRAIAAVVFWRVRRGLKWMRREEHLRAGGIAQLRSLSGRGRDE